MDNSQLFSGSICLTDLLFHAKKGHSAFTKAENGKIYCNIKVWLNEMKDRYGNTMGLQLNSKNERRDSEGTIYIGNARPVERKEGQVLSHADMDDLDIPSDLPF